MKKVQVVIGAQFGDEGKGLVTDYLASLHPSSQVVRFNGGAQASHSVVHNEHRHAFKHFGSNSFLPSSSTYLSRFFILNVHAFNDELTKLHDIGVYPVVSAHHDCMVTTIFDMAINGLLEQKRGSDKHGSCGMGINETVRRTLAMDDPIRARDISTPSILYNKMLEVQEEWFPKSLEEYGLTLPPHMEFLLEPHIVQHEVGLLVNTWGNGKLPIHFHVPDHDHIVFEGAQGLLLSEKWCPITPHVTRSYTGMRNVLDITDPNNTEYDVYYVTRCYTTRHGAGPLHSEVDGLIYQGIHDPNNVYNEHQEHIRYGVLDLDLLLSAIEDDICQLKHLNCKINLVITCLDQTETVLFYHNEVQRSMAVPKFKKYMLDIVKSKHWNKLLVSFGPTRSTITSYK